MVNAQILVVEDEGIIALGVESQLKSMGYAVPALASSGEEALTKAAETQPDLVLMDIRLKGELDGIAAAEQIRCRYGIPVVYLTAHADDDTLSRAKKTEPAGYVLKPIDTRELHASIELALYKHQMERKLRQAERWLAATLKSIGEAVVATDENGHVVFINPVAEALTGWKRQEALGQDSAAVLRLIDPQTRQPVERALVTGAREGTVGGLATAPLLISKGGAETPIEHTVAPIRDEQGGSTGSIWVFRDITARQQAEAALAERTAELARSNGELEQFAYVASHDLQEPLRMVVLYTQLLARRYQQKLGAEADEFLGYIVGGATRMHQLIEDLLAYSRVSGRRGAYKPVDCKAVLDRALANLRAAVEESGAVVTHDPLPTLMADPLQLEQLFQNLLGNAIKFRGEASPGVHVSAELSHPPPAEVGSRPPAEWVFSVRDNGIGINPQQAERIFALFQRLHSQAAYPGTGIGLALCKKIVERRGGRIWVESGPGPGATFYFTVPAERRRKDRRQLLLQPSDRAGA